MESFEEFDLIEGLLGSAATQVSASGIIFEKLGDTVYVKNPNGFTEKEYQKRGDTVYVKNPNGFTEKEYQGR